MNFFQDYKHEEIFHFTIFYFLIQKRKKKNNYSEVIVKIYNFRKQFSGVKPNLIYL